MREEIAFTASDNVGRSEKGSRSRYCGGYGLGIARHIE